MPDSQQQVRWAHSVLEGGAKGDKKFAQEVVSKMHGRKMSSLPVRAGTPAAAYGMDVKGADVASITKEKVRRRYQQLFGR
jgi:hypothetical protein